MRICRALLVLYRHSPVLRERSAEDCIVADLNDKIADPDVYDEQCQSELEFGELATNDR